MWFMGWVHRSSACLFYWVEKDRRSFPETWSCDIKGNWSPGGLASKPIKRAAMHEPPEDS